MHLTDGQVDKGVRVDDLHGVLTHQLELHDDDVVLNVLQINGVSVGGLRLDLSLVNRLAVEEVLELLLPLAFDQQLVPVVRLLVDLVEVFLK